MSELEELHFSHVGRVKVDFLISARNLDPAAITEATGVSPTSSSMFLDKDRSLSANVDARTRQEKIWSLSSASMIESKDVNEHFRFLLDVLLPHHVVIGNLLDSVAGTSFFDVLWESDYLYAGTGPVLSQDVIDGVAKLRASIGFDIYDISD